MTYHNKDFRICISFEKQVKLTCTEKLRHNDFNKFKFSTMITRKFEQNLQHKTHKYNIVENKYF